MILLHLEPCCVSRTLIAFQEKQLTRITEPAALPVFLQDPLQPAPFRHQHSAGSEGNRASKDREEPCSGTAGIW